MMQILKRVDERFWLDRSETDIDNLLTAIEPYPEDDMHSYMVDKMVGNVANDSKESIEEISFYALVRDDSIYRYPEYELVEKEDRKSAIYTFAMENNMTIAELEDEGVWMGLPDGAMVRYSVTERE